MLLDGIRQHRGGDGPRSRTRARGLRFAGSVTCSSPAPSSRGSPTPYTAAIGTSLGIVGKSELAVTGNIIGAHPTGPRSCAGGLVANPTATSGTPLDELTQTYTGQQLHDPHRGRTVRGLVQDRHGLEWWVHPRANLVNLTIDRLWSGTGFAAFARSPPTDRSSKGSNGVEEFSVSQDMAGSNTIRSRR